MKKEISSELLQEVTEAALRHQGFSEEQIVETRKPPDHSRCEIYPEGVEDHTDERGNANHPAHDAAYEMAWLIEFTLEHPAVQAAFLADPPKGPEV